MNILLTSIVYCIVHFNRSFLIVLALKTKTRVMALLVPISSKFNPNLVKISVPFRLPVGLSLGIGVSILIVHLFVKVLQRKIKLWV